MKKGKIAYLASVVTMAAVLSLTGCKGGNTEGEPVIHNRADKSALEYYIEMPDVKTYDTHEHCFYRTYRPMQKSGSNSYSTTTVCYNDQGSIEVPEGYEIISVTGVSYTTSRYNETTDFVVWFTNTEPVEVKPVYNEDTNCFDYSDFGTPIELELDKAKTMK